MIISSINGNAQNPKTITTKKTTVKTIRDIPHKTPWEKWMWIHRSIAFTITKERPVNYDTAYIKSYKKRLVVTLPISNRYLKFNLTDLESGNQLIFAPNLQYNLGISVSSRWATFVYLNGLKLFTNNVENKGKTKYKDFQLNLYGRKFTTDMFLQNYSGFYIKNSKSFADYLSDKPYAIRADVNAFHMGISSFYVVNNKKFSYRNSFAFAEQQKKKAGSLLLGLYYSYFRVDGSPSLVIAPFSSSFDTLSLIKSGQMYNFGLNVGYIYTYVFLKKCYTTASIVQGIGGEEMVYKRNDNSTYHKFSVGAGKLNLRFALGYDNGRYIVGTMGLFNYFLLNKKMNSTFTYSYAKIMIYTGYRFSVLKKERKLLKKWKLVDY